MTRPELQEEETLQAQHPFTESWAMFRNHSRCCRFGAPNPDHFQRDLWPCALSHRSVRNGLGTVLPSR